MKNASYCVSYGKERRLQQNELKSSFCYSLIFLDGAILLQPLFRKPLFELQAIFEGFAHSFVYQIIAMCIWIKCNGIN